MIIFPDFVIKRRRDPNIRRYVLGRYIFEKILSPYVSKKGPKIPIYLVTLISISRSGHQQKIEKNIKIDLPFVS